MIQLLAVGEVRGPLRAALDDYEGRVGRYWRWEAVEVPRARLGGAAAPARIQEEEGERILARIPSDAMVVALTVRGTPLDSPGLARFLEREVLHSGRKVTFVVGGAFGLSQGVLARASRTLSLGSGTLPHELARVILTEQIYRAGTILRNEPYHKGSTD